MDKHIFSILKMAKTIKITNGDLAVGATGIPSYVTGIEKLGQDIGDALANAGFNMILGASVQESYVESRIRDVINNLKVNQELDGDKVSPEERISKINRILVHKDGFTIYFYVEVLSESGKTIGRAYSLTKMDNLAPPTGYPIDITHLLGQ